ncbi:MAG: hypothetical protein OXC15_16455 [Rhodospirillaceae bacterium]|nr:hypothetical protein [Rhodospirillaceae bacterium]
MSVLPSRLLRLLSLAVCLLAPATALAESEPPSPVDDEEIERSAAMALGLTAAPDAGLEGRSVLLTMAVQGHASSQYQLGLMLLEGAGIDRDHAQGVRWLERAASRGHEGALAHLTGMAARDDVAAHLALGLIASGHARGGRAAVRHLGAAAAAGDPQGLLALGELYRAGDAVETDEAYAAILFRAAAEAAMNAVQRARREATAGILGPDSDEWLEVAVARTRAAHASPPERNADQPELFARYWVGLALLVGAGTMVDTPRGIAHHRAAAERGFGLAEYSLGMLYQRGHGLPRNLDSARHWLARAAAHGHPLADQAL